MFERLGNFLLSFLLSEVKVSKDDLLKAMDYADTDADGYISLGEIVKIAKELSK